MVYPEACVCNTCKQLKPLSEYYFNRGYKMSMCKECFREFKKTNYRKYIDKRREANREYHRSEAGKEKNRRNLVEAKKRHPEKFKARNAVHNAIKRGVIQKQPCAMCGEINAQAHHSDYSKPLEVVWLCHKHHLQIHGRWAGDHPLKIQEEELVSC